MPHVKKSPYDKLKKSESLRQAQEESLWQAKKSELKALLLQRDQFITDQQST